MPLILDMVREGEYRLKKKNKKRLKKVKSEEYSEELDKSGELAQRLSKSQKYKYNATRRPIHLGKPTIRAPRRRKMR